MATISLSPVASRSGSACNHGQVRFRTRLNAIEQDDGGLVLVLPDSAPLARLEMPSGFIWGTIGSRTYLRCKAWWGTRIEVTLEDGDNPYIEVGTLAALLEVRYRGSTLNRAWPLGRHHRPVAGTIKDVLTYRDRWCPVSVPLNPITGNTCPPMRRVLRLDRPRSRPSSRSRRCLTFEDNRFVIEGDWAVASHGESSNLLVLGVNRERTGPISLPRFPNRDWPTASRWQDSTHDRVYIHRGMDGWRFLFCLFVLYRPQYAPGPPVRDFYKDELQALDHEGNWFVCELAYLIPTWVGHEECAPYQRAMRGVAFRTVQGIWNVPGMCLALRHAFNELQGEIRKTATDLRDWTLRRVPISSHMLAAHNQTAIGVPRLDAVLNETLWAAGPNTLCRPLDPGVHPVAKRSRRRLSL